MKKINFTPNERLINKADIEKENVEAFISEGFYLNEETLKKVLTLTSSKIILESDDEKLKDEINLGVEVEILSLSSKIIFEKNWFYLPDFINLIRTKKLKITFMI